MKAETVVDWLRAEIANHELMLSLADSRIAYYSALMKRYKGKTSAKMKSRFVRCKAERETWTAFRSDMMLSLGRLSDGIDRALSSYPPAYGKVFRLCLLDGLSEKDAASALSMSEEAVIRILGKLKADLITFYRP